MSKILIDTLANTKYFYIFTSFRSFQAKKIIEIMGLNIFVFSLFSPFSFIFFPFPPYFPVPQRKPKKEKEKERLTEVFYNYVNVHVLCVLYLLQFGLNIVVVCLPAGLCEGRQRGGFFRQGRPPGLSPILIQTISLTDLLLHLFYFFLRKRRQSKIQTIISASPNYMSNAERDFPSI